MAALGTGRARQVRRLDRSLEGRRAGAGRFRWLGSYFVMGFGACLAVALLAACSASDRATRPVDPAMGEARTDPPPAEGGTPTAGAVRSRGAQPGEPCEQRRCVGGAICVGYGDDARCSAECDPGTAFCPDGALCLAIRDGQTGVCSSWGAGVEGAPCSTATDCAPALACVSLLGNPPTCVRVCDFTGDTAVCPSNRECVITSFGLSYGVCSEE